MAGLITELRRRHVFRAAGVYIVAAWVAVQVASLVFPAIGVPDRALLYVWLVALLLFPVVLVFAWHYDISWSGVSRTPPATAADSFDPSLRRTDYLILAALASVAVVVTLQMTSRIGSIPETIREAIPQFSIAVLPFDDLGGDPQQQYFVSGMQAGLISGLSRISRLKVTSKTSTMRYRNSDLLLNEVGQRLGVARVVEGSVFRDGPLVNVAVRLLDTQSDEQLWSANYESDIKDILQLQSRVAREIAGQIGVPMSPDERAGFTSSEVVNPDAYEAFLKGVFHVERYNPDDIQQAARYFQQAVELDPDFAMGHWGLAKLCLFQAQAGILTPAQARAQCRSPMEKALELDPLLPEAYSGLASTLTWQHFDFEAARPHFERAIELNPSFAEAHMFYSHFLGIVGELEKSSEHMQLALELDPLNPFVHALSAVQLVMLGDFEEAVIVAQRVLDENPGFGFGYVTLFMGHHYLGNEDDAVSGFAGILEHVAGEPELAAMVREMYANLGYRKTLLQVGAMMAEQAKATYVPPMTIASLYDQGGDIEKAIDWYETAYRDGDPDAPYIGAITKEQEINAHPRFQQLLRDMKLYYWADKFADQQAAGD